MSDATWTRPLPEADAVSRPFWEGCGRGELLIQRCPACGHRQFYPRAACTACGETPEWERASGRGVVHTFTVIRQNHAKPFRDELPYVVAIVELEEGVRLMTNLTDCPVEDVSVGLPVEAHFVSIDDDLAAPFFRPA